MTTTAIIGMDISKYSFELCGTDARGKHTLHKRLHRDKVALFFANLPPCTVAMESCSSSQHWARKIKELGHPSCSFPLNTLSRFAKESRTTATMQKLSPKLPRDPA